MLPQTFCPEIARKWHALAERRRSNLVDLYDTGRWRLYYTEDELVVRMRQAIGLSEGWARVAEPQTGLHPAE